MLTDRSRIARSLCSTLAIATALIVGPGLAQAQSFQGNGTFASGTGTIGTATGTTTIDITSSDAVIDWTTFDTAVGGGPINFQPASTTATFQSVSDFSVLNRIIPTDPSRAVQFNGNVVAQIQGGSPVPGGTVYFYSPGGVIVGSTAVFNVGNLGLTSAAPQIVGGAFEQGTPPNEFVNFTAANPGTAVRIQPGAQINVLDSSYLAIVAPVIEQRGTISVDGVAALVSADAATITFNQNGLFDIQVTSGTSGTGTTLFNDGSITGPAFSGIGPNHRIYAVAVPKNTAITLAIGAGSTLGFNIAGAADVVGNAVVLSAGYDVVGGQAQSAPSPAGGTGQAGTFIGAVNVSSALTARSTANTFVFANTGESATFASDLNVSGATTSSSPNAVQVRANGTGANLSVAGTVTLTALDPTLVAPSSGFSESRFAAVDVNDGAILNIGGGLFITNAKTGGTKTGPTDARLAATGGAQATINGPVTVTADRVSGSEAASAAEIFATTGATINITGATTLNARGIGANGASPGNFGGNATGGVGVIQALSGGDVAITGPVVVNASANGGNGNAAGGGSAIGGLAQIFARDAGSTLTITGTASVLATGAAGVSASGFTAGFGTGGTALVNAQVAASNGISITGATNIDASGFGGGTTNSAAGIGTGGTASVAVSDNNTVQFGSTLDIFASGQGGTTSNGSVGSGNGGTARLNLFSNGTLTINGNTQLFATGLNGNGNPRSGIARGGTVGVTSQTGSTLDINGFLIAGAGGLGNGSAMVPGTGFGIGGNVTVAAFTNGSIDVSGVLRARAPGIGANGGSGDGGTVTVSASSGGDLIAGELNILATATGSANTGNGDSAVGGTANLTATGAGSTLTIVNGNVTGVANQGELEFISAQAFGGQANGSGVGGSAVGGSVNITASNGATLTGPSTPGTNGFLRVIARATGGNANTGATAGGQATGGAINITIDNATMTSANMLPSSFAMGGSFTTGATGNIAGGNAIGGSRNITVNNGGSLTTQFIGGGPGAQGGNGLGTGNGGSGTGGSANLTVDNGSTLSLTGSSGVFSQNSGGAGGSAGMGGNGVAGTAFVRVANGSTLTMAGPTTNSFFVGATAFGSFSPTVSLSGSNSTAGTATFVIENATANLQTVNVSADGTGGGGLVSTGGNGTGGNALLQLIGATLTADSVIVSAVGSGGSLDVGQSGVAGNGTGGLARIIATGGTSTVTAAQEIGIGADGLGGNIGGAAGTTTGNGVGGRAALVTSNAASLTLNAPSVTLAADGEGGEATGPTDFGGDGTGGQADVFANSGNITVNGDLFLEADNDGGEGTVGGDGLRRTDGVANVLLRAQNGSITVSGVTALASVGEGDSGANASGGLVVIDPQNSLAGSSTITLNDLVVDAIAVGGAGISAPSPTQPGGDGGDAFGGSIVVLGSAGNGNLFVNGSTFLDASAFGGAGGTGHPGATGTTGGVGGNATGGGIQFGTKSGALDTGAVNTGSAEFQAVEASSNASGGIGGAGGSGTTQGVGGAGGNAQSGGVTLLVRGSPVTITGGTILSADATGGEGGPGSVQGLGGDAIAGGSGGIAILATSRFMQPTQRGTLDAQAISATVIATSGPGSVAGATIIGDSPFALEFGSSSGSAASIDMVAQGDNLIGALPSRIMLTDGTLDISGALSVSTGDALSVTLDRFTVNVTDLAIEAENFVLAATRPATLGTFNVSGNLNVFSGADFLAYANFSSAFDGLFEADGSVLVGDLAFDGDLAIAAPGSITTGLVTANNVALDSGQAILTAAVSASGSIDLVASGAITTGQLTASDTVEANAGGALNVAGASAGLVNPSTDPLAEYNVGLRSLTSVAVGNVAARANFGVSSPGSIAVGNVSVGQVFLALPGTSLTTGSISTALQAGSRVYIGNYSMEALGGQVSGTFDPAPILALAPVATGGPIAINGPVSTITIQANTLQSITATGAIQTPGATVLVAGTTIDTADIAVGDRAIIFAGGNITLGNVNAGIAIPSNGLRKIAIGSGSGSVTTGNLASVFDLGVQAAGSISTGTLLGRQILLLAGTNVSTAAISALAGTQPVGQLYVGNFSMATPTANVFQPFQSPTAGPLPIFGLTPVRTGGSITFGGSVLAGNVDVAAGTGFTASAITASNDIDIEAGGLASVNGAWSSTDIDLISSDIAIASTGSLTATATGEILLASTNSAGMFVGDGLAGATSPTGDNAGYRLSNDEFSRIRAGEISIVGDDISTLATDLTIGNLTINASQLNGANGIVLFASGNRATETPSGILRIAGAVTANGFAPTTSIELLSGTVEIEAERGSLKVNAGQSDSGTSGSSSLGGLIYVEADRIHVASDAILTKLRADPLYTGHIDELNAPAAVQRPDGVFNALGFEINVGETFYVQNTGSQAVPAGFVTTFDNTDVFASGDRTGGVEIVINGQFQTSTGTVTGRAAFDQVIADPTADSEQFFGFSENSQLNGCVFLSGVCAFGQSDPVAAISSEISVIISPVLAASPPPPAVEDAGPGDSSASSSDSEAAAEEADTSDDEKKDEGDGDGAASPIAPPTPLISTRALDGEVNVVEPVSGAGNPALFGSAVDETTVQGVKP